MISFKLLNHPGESRDPDIFSASAGRTYAWIPACAGMALLFIAFLFVSVANAAAKEADQPEVDPALCNALVKHTPDADVEYQPGVDVNGNAVAPADLPGSPQIQLPKVIQIPLTLSLAKAIHLDPSKYPVNQFGSGTEIQLGTITVEGDKVLYNGQPLGDEQQDNLAVLCMKPNASKP